MKEVFLSVSFTPNLNFSRSAMNTSVQNIPYMLVNSSVLTVILLIILWQYIAMFLSNSYYILP